MALRGRGSFNVGVELEGNWVKFNEIVNSTNILLVMAAREGQKEFAESYRDEVKKNILTGGKRFGYPSNSARYTILKLRSGGVATAMVWSRAFANAVEIRNNNAGTRYMVGIPKGARRPSYGPKWDKNKLTIAEYANILEHGTNKIPERPVFSDTLKSMGGKEGLKKVVELAIVKKYGARGAIITKL